MITDRKSNKPLTVFGLVMINVIAIDSLRNLPSNAATGLHIIFYFLLAGALFLLPCVYLTTRLARYQAKTGGAYIWIRAAFGRDWGFLGIWLQWIYNVFWYPTILSFIATNIAYLINPALMQNKLFMLTMIIGLFSIATLLNNRGIKTSSRISNISAILGTLVPMLAIILLGIAWLIMGDPIAIAPTTAHFIPTNLSTDNAAFLVVIFFSLMGIEMSAVHAGDVKNPEHNYPKALMISSTLIIITMTLASAAIAIVVPKGDLNIISGLDQAFGVFLNAFHLKWLMPLIIIAMVIGAFGGMAAWVLGPTRGLMVAAEEGCAPRIFGRSNQHGAPSTLLFAQWGIVVLLSCCFLLFKTFSTWYWILSNLTAELALLFYILLFAAAMFLPGVKHRKTTVAGTTGIAACLFAMGIGLVPPADMHISHIWVYELLIIGGTMGFTLLPFLLYRAAQK